MSRVAIYARVSTDEQTHAGTIEAQVYRCQEYCKAKGYEVAGEFKDEGVSGSVPLSERLEGQRLLEAADVKLFDKVVVLCVDRLSRDVVDAAIIRRELEHKKTPLEFVLQSFDATAEGELMYSQFAAFAQYERRVIGRRTNEGRQRRVRNGKWQGSVPPYGYRYDREVGQLEPNAETAGVVRQMFRWSLDGLGTQAIANALTKMGVEPPNTNHHRRKQSAFNWHQTTVYKILTHPRYVGRQTYGADRLEMACPAIVEEHLFETVTRGLKRRRGRPPSPTRFHILRGLLKCRACGSPYFVHEDGRGHAEYQCARRRRYANAETVQTLHDGIRWRWPVARLDDRVKKVIEDLYADPATSLAKLELEVRRAQDAVRQQDGTSQRTRLMTRLDKLDEDEVRLLLRAKRNQVGDAERKRLQAEIDTERGEVERELEQVKSASQDTALMLEAIEWFRELCSSATPSRGFVDEATGEPTEPTAEQWRHLLTGVADEIIVENDGSLTFQGPFKSLSGTNKHM